jgi:hypothetical protein
LKANLEEGSAALSYGTNLSPSFFINMKNIPCAFRPGAEDEGPYNFTRIGAGMVDSEVRLSGLEKFTKYSIIVQAFNNRGDGPSSDPVIVQTLEDGEKVFYLETFKFGY